MRAPAGCRTEGAGGAEKGQGPRVPSEKEIYASHAREYEELTAHEDYQGNILRAVREIAPLEGAAAVDLGAGTGRLARLLQPYVQRVIALDLSPHMLRIARDKLRAAGRNWQAAAADHRRLPLASHSADLIVSGWSASYVAVWGAERWRAEAEAWLQEAQRVLRRGGRLILFESLGTGNETPQRLPHLENFLGWLDEAGFRSRWIRTDYRFGSPEEAARTAGFFFGDETGERILRGRMTILPECTGIWWRSG